jgi:hypothetical protein
VLERRPPEDEEVMAKRTVLQDCETRDDHDKEAVAQMLGEVIGQRAFGHE